MIAAVGDGMRFKVGLAGKFFSALGEAKVNVIAMAQGSSERNLSAIIRTEETERALRAVHAAFMPRMEAEEWVLARSWPVMSRSITEPSSKQGAVDSS